MLAKLKEFLLKNEDESDKTNIREIKSKEYFTLNIFNGFPKELISYYCEIGTGSVRECQFEIHEPVLFKDTVEDSENKDYLVIGHDFNGNLFCLNLNKEHRFEFYDHERECFEVIESSFLEFIIEESLMGEDGEDLRS